MTMIEKVARAIYEKRNGSGCAAWARLPRAHQAPYLSDADAAISAMETPTEEMLKAVREIGGDRWVANAQAVWPTMITAALKG